MDERTDVNETERCRIYRTRCISRLKAMNLPISGWDCTAVEDTLKDGGVGLLCDCDLCGTGGVRYLHYMSHPDCDCELAVGRICAGIMEGDELAAEEREKQLRLRSERLSRFLKRKWYPLKIGNAYDESILSCKHRGIRIFIAQIKSDNPRDKPGFEIIIDGERIERAGGGVFKSFDDARMAAFAIADPPK